MRNLEGYSGVKLESEAAGAERHPAGGHRPEPAPEGLREVPGAVTPAPHRLHTMGVGTAGPRLAFLHGLFGQGRNWTQIAKAVAGPDGTGARCLLVDLPDHGRSPWTRGVLLRGVRRRRWPPRSRPAAPGEPWIARRPLARRQGRDGDRAAPPRARRPPRRRRHRAQGLRLARAVRGLHRRDAGPAARRADEPRRRRGPLRRGRARRRGQGFLLQNLRRDGTSGRWQANLDLFARDAAPGHRLADRRLPRHRRRPLRGPGRVARRWRLELRQGRRHRADARPFPRARPVVVKGVGHWVHTEAPEVVTETLRRVLRLLPCRLAVGGSPPAILGR